jgi:hypothetical protein
MDNTHANQAIAFDHFFICTAMGAPEAEHLISLGLREGRSNTHPGQGTANRCFFFENFMLELLWVENPAEAQSEVIVPTRLWERWNGRWSPTDRRSSQVACPFGVCLRSETSVQLPFSTWDYRPPYLLDTSTLSMANNSNDVTEPLLFHLYPCKRPSHQPLDHPLGLRKLTRISLSGPYGNAPSPELLSLCKILSLDLDCVPEHVVKLGFDDELQQQQIDCRPGLPLIISY